MHELLQDFVKMRLIQFLIAVRHTQKTAVG